MTILPCYVRERASYWIQDILYLYYQMNIFDRRGDILPKTQKQHQRARNVMCIVNISNIIHLR